MSEGNNVSLKEHITSELNHLKDNIEDKLKAILDQTTKTNGRVNKLCDWRDEVEVPLKEIIQDKIDSEKFFKQKKREITWSYAVKITSVIIVFAIMGIIQYFVGVSALDKAVEYKLKGMTFVVDESDKIVPKITN